MGRALICYIYILILSLLFYSSFTAELSVIVYMGSQLTIDVESLHDNMLAKVLGEKSNKSLLHHFKSFNGFAARMTLNELEEIARLEGVVSAFQSTRKKLHTTKSWNFLGFPENVPRNVTENDIIVGIIDTGIWPESSSFDDKDFGPPPAKWKGTCETSSNFKCNNKIIGARYYRTEGNFFPGEVASPLDNTEGHGTHTASTAAGNLVNEASLLGLGLGTARGGIPSARIAVYKVCWQGEDSCDDIDILRAFDDAIADGVDIISISAGGDKPVPYFIESIAIGSFHAMQHGILTSNSAGNGGPKAFSVSSVAPWLLSVAASTINRKFKTEVLLGNNMLFEGISINTYDMNNTLYPLIRARDAANITGGFNGSISAWCDVPNSLDQNMVEGKIVVCEETTGGNATLLEAGASGAIMLVPDLDDSSSLYPLPASVIKLEPNGTSAILDYLDSTRPTATILRSQEISDTLASSIVSFSSRGPNKITPQILKPDLAAPGVHILAAWPPTIPPSEVQGDKRVATFNFASGTSMACPHATGAAAYVKSFHPLWSPAAIKSALMTTANPVDVNEDSKQDGLAYGAGNLNPLKAIDPGLIYDLSMSDYINFLCGIGYDKSKLRDITRDNITCARNLSSSDLNLPSFAVPVHPSIPIIVEFHRTVTNVGSPKSKYIASVAAPSGLSIQVEPGTLSFKSLGETQAFLVKVETTLEKGTVLSGSLSWYDGIHLVRSPIVAFALESRST